MSNTYQDLMHTNFPESLDVFLEKQDILSTDSALLGQYEEAIKAGDFSSANEIFLQIADGNKKILTSSTMLQWRDALLALERYFNDNVKSYVLSKQLEWDLQIGDMRYIGIFCLGASYTKYNLVTYKEEDEYNLYMCNVSETVNVLPTDKDIWVKITEKGSVQISDLYASITNKWIKNSPYRTQSITGHLNKIWSANGDNVYEEPSVSASWIEIVDRKTMPMRRIIYE